jgi:hypothetical protein
MAKATAPDTTALSASEAAGAIVALINGSPRSPRQDEIEAIIAKAIAPVSQPSTLLPKVREAVARLNRGRGKQTASCARGVGETGPQSTALIR